MRPCFYDFPGDTKSWEVEDQYMYGDRYLCVPALYPELKTGSVYLHEGSAWQIFEGQSTYRGGQVIEVDCPIDSMLVFTRK
jgi:alpha-D-xyloside xylohydrolase